MYGDKCRTGLPRAHRRPAFLFYLLCYKVKKKKISTTPLTTRRRIIIIIGFSRRTELRSISYDS